MHVLDRAVGVHLEQVARIGARSRGEDDLGVTLGVVRAEHHFCISGKWTAPGVAVGAGANFIVNVAFGNDKAVNVMNVGGNATEHPCFACGDAECTCRVAPGACAPEPWFDMAADGSHTYATYARARYSSLGQLMNAGCNWPRSGTFDWSPSANQDPMFYALHWYTFVALERGHRALVEATGKTVLEQLEEYADFVGGEREGLGLFDQTEFRDFVPYKAGATRGARHTWHEIIEYFHSERDFVIDA